MRNQGYGDTISLGTLPCACTLRPCLTYLQLFCSYQNKQAQLCHSLCGGRTPARGHEGGAAKHPNLNHGQDTRANRTRHTTSSSTQSHAKQQHTNATRHTSRSHAHTHPSRHTPSATPTRERTRQGNHRLRDLHRPLRQRLRPLPPLLLHRRTQKKDTSKLMCARERRAPRSSWFCVWSCRRLS